MALLFSLGIGLQPTYIQTYFSQNPGGPIVGNK